ncbi:MAG: TIGR04348 family glycosyltransferase [Acidobacteriia bacterium]|nr:TIGR04348 family glycosyltransferase [Terriglobia bacterium]
MRIVIACPAPRGAHSGNRVTAERWRTLLRELGHVATIDRDAGAGPADLLVAVHATRSAAAIARFRRRSPRAPTIVTLAGTDLYVDLPGAPEAWGALEPASRLVVLHPLAAESLPPGLRDKTRVILQSARAPAAAPPRSRRFFDVAVAAHLRGVKDPFRAEEAVRGLPSSSRLRVRHAGRVLESGLGREARRRAAANPRYSWLGERSGSEARRLIAGSRLLVVTSRSEGGANVVSEAVVSGVPVVATRIPCTIGLLGEGYPGFFEVGDTAGLRRLLLRAEGEPGFLRTLAAWCRGRRPLFAPARERGAWRRLLGELGL